MEVFAIMDDRKTYGVTVTYITTKEEHDEYFSKLDPDIVAIAEIESKHQANMRLLADKEGRLPEEKWMVKDT